MKQTQSSFKYKHQRAGNRACRYITRALRTQYWSLLKDQSTFIANRRARRRTFPAKHRRKKQVRIKRRRDVIACGKSETRSNKLSRYINISTRWDSLFHMLVSVSVSCLLWGVCLLCRVAHNRPLDRRANYCYVWYWFARLQSIAGTQSRVQFDFVLGCVMSAPTAFDH